MMLWAVIFAETTTPDKFQQYCWRFFFFFAEKASTATRIIFGNSDENILDIKIQMSDNHIFETGNYFISNDVFSQQKDQKLMP